MKHSIDDHLVVIGKIRSVLTRIDMCPKQAKEGAPNATVEIRPEYASALQGITAGSELLILTWLHLANRDTQLVHPRGNPDNPLTGVFLTRSPDRPNPIGLHRVTVLAVDGLTLHVSAIEALDQTPVIDIKKAVKNDR
ncbi:MAG: tRNA (N6-threonylcarbamoyladenosine(37)-N6)-methyltransferase TrmO [Desulfobacteraceae bacterium]|jgi:tRNA-Thr(GGU) m(6)t(6)A37 methyltransferase TsaA